MPRKGTYQPKTDGQRRGMTPAAFGEHQRSRILDFIRRYQASYATSPSVAEIGAGVGIAEDNARKHLQKLVEAGKLEKGAGYRSFRILEQELTVEQQLPWVVSDLRAIKPDGRYSLIACFDTEQRAAEYISTLPDHLDGRYALDGPPE